MTHTHGGNLRALALAARRTENDILDFSANINPLGPPEWLRSVISANVERLAHYPDPACVALIEAIASRYGVNTEETLVGNGSTELLYLLPRALNAKRALIPMPAYIDYANAASLAGLKATTFPLREDDGFALDLNKLEYQIREHDVVFLGQPNNPTGLISSAEALRALARRHPTVIFILDEAFIDFVANAESLSHQRPDNVIALLSLTKIFAVPGLRLGCAIADRAIVRRAREIQPPWSVNTLAQAVGASCLRDNQYLERARIFVSEQRQKLTADLEALGRLTVYPGQANFLLLRIDQPKLPNQEPINAHELARLLLREGIAIRVCDNFDGLDDRFFRVAVRTDAENQRLITALQKALLTQKETTIHMPTVVARKRQAATLMFQGASSSAGKSVLTAALCRILLQDGYRVAPFKAQNMSLNSFVTRDGGEMGRAQVVQAQACRIEPDTRMNPILLKPNSDTGAQVIVNGKSVGNMSIAQYVRYKSEAFEIAKNAFDALANEYDVVVLEGAGSPAEINLKSHDIVNMNMARYANASVLLVGDIDRGGVFASFIGVMETLAEWERALLRGFIINRFRGDESLLADALNYTFRHTGRPVLGVVPYLPQLALPEEDSVAFKNGDLDDRRSLHESVEIAVIDLPHISNFTDFDSLRLETDVRLRIIRSAQELATPDAVILPGSKSVIHDLTYLRQQGFDRRIGELASAGKTEIIGICGGFQILGERIDDPQHIESSQETIEGLRLLALSTMMTLNKTLTRATAKHLSSGLLVHGYEIHHGQSDTVRAQAIIQREDGDILGVATDSERIWGTYLHGIFDADEFRRWFINRLRKRKGLPTLNNVHASFNLEPTFERLAETARHSIKIAEIYRMMGLKK